MASRSCSISASIPISARRLSLSFSSRTHFLLLRSVPPLSLRGLRSPPRSSERPPSQPQEKVARVVPETRAWVVDLGEGDSGEEDGEYDEGGAEDQEQSLDLLFRFLHNAFGKMSRRLRKAARSVLPPFIPTKLVRFAVNGILILAFLWILKAFIEVICTVGVVVFTSVLLVRMSWSFLSYVMENQHDYASRIGNEDSRWSGTGAA